MPRCVVLCVISGCFLLQRGGRSSEQNLHRQPQGRAHTGACQNQHLLVSATPFCVSRIFFKSNSLSDLRFLHLRVSLSGSAAFVKWSTTYSRSWFRTRKQTFPPQTPSVNATTGTKNFPMIPSRKKKTLSPWKPAEEPVPEPSDTAFRYVQVTTQWPGGNHKVHKVHPQCCTDLTDTHSHTNKETRAGIPLTMHSVKKMFSTQNFCQKGKNRILLKVFFSLFASALLN